MSRPRYLLALTGLLLFAGNLVLAEQRFPPPDFENGHQLPTTTIPAARALVFQYLDVAALAGALVLSSWLVYRKRSRKGLAALSIFSVLYFGFWRKGCICSIGSIQNVGLAIGDAGYQLPLVALLFFALPLAFALFGGRTFCAAVCPHGALQDLVLLKPMKIPGWLEQGLGLLPFIYLGAGVLFAVTGSAFIICQYDPFVPIFRMNGRLLMVLAGGALLLLGTVVGRPYCRFLCPYGALLKLAASVAKWRVRVTPDYCTQCRLCEASCPFGAMREPQTAKPEAGILSQDRARLTWFLLLLPLLVAGGGWLGSKFSGPASLVHPTVNLAHRLALEGQAEATHAINSPSELELERARQSPDEIKAQAARICNRFRVAGWIFGSWLGLVIGGKLIALTLRRKRTDYEPAEGDCFACARCFEYCPNELVRRGLGPVVVPTQAMSRTE